MNVHQHQPSNDATSLAWAWVLQRATMIRGIAFRVAQGTGVDADDLHGDLLLRLVERHDKFDPALSKASTWIWWQARAVKKELVNARSRRLHETPVDEAVHPVVTFGAAEAVVMLHQLRTLASTDEWTAALARGIGHEGDDLGAACGCAPFSARRRVTRLLDRASA